MTRLLLALLCCMSGMLHAADDQPIDQVALLRTQMQTMITTLASSDSAAIEAFIRTYVQPEELAKIEAHTPISELVAGFMGAKQAGLQTYLQQALALEPSYDAETGIYSFSIEGAPSPLRFHYDDEAAVFHIYN